MFTQAKTFSLHGKKEARLPEPGRAAEFPA